MAPFTRKRSVSNDISDVRIGSNPEKARYSYESSDEETDATQSSPQSSRDGYNSREPILARARAYSYPRKSAERRHSPVRRPSRSLSAYAYRVPHRTMRWLCIALFSSLLVFIFSLWRMSMTSANSLEKAMLDRPKPPAPWESFEFLKRYYGGIWTLQSNVTNEPEYPAEGGNVDWNRTYGSTKQSVPPIGKITPYPDYQSTTYKDTYASVFECFLDEQEQVKVPSVYGYGGVTEGFPEAVFGSYELLGLDDGVCYDRYGKLGPYGFGYSIKKGGVGAGLEGERSGADVMWKSTTPVDYAKVRWGDAQKRCFEKNRHRFTPPNEAVMDNLMSMPAVKRENDTNTDNQPPKVKKTIPRTAVIIRTWRDYPYTPEAIMYLRGLIAELSLLSSGEYQVHFLIHVKDDNHPIWADEEVYNRTLKEALPEEFAGMGTLWSERQMGLIYGGIEESFYRKLPVHGVYRSAHFPLQWFAHNHPEYEYFWNWEMDVRYTGHWYKLFSRVSTWAEAQPRKGLWERNERFYIPSVHGGWDDFKQMARVQSEMAPPASNNKWANVGPPDVEKAPNYPQPSVWGPFAHPDTPKFESDPEAPTAYEKDHYEWGVGEAADLITFNPIFDPARTSWLLAEDATGYNLSAGVPPRRTAIIASARLSRRLLAAMHTEVAIHRHTMFTEMWPCTAALHHGMKAVYAPHPVFIDRAWPTNYLAGVFNGGLNGASGGARTSVFGDLEHNFRGVTWYYNSGFSGNLWRRWLGKRVDNGGGEVEEMDGEGRMCLPGVLLHPVKEVSLVIEGE